MSKPQNKTTSAQSIWFGFAETRPTKKGTRRIHLRWGRMGILALFLAACFWLVAATALYFVYKEQKGYSEIAFADVLWYPLRRDEIRQKHGNFNIEEAKVALENQDFRAAYNRLLNGVRRAPDNLEGRILLIRFFEAQGHHEGTRGLFEGGVQYAGNDLNFYRLYGQFLVQQRDDKGTLQLVEQVHQQVARDSELGRVMALFGMQAAGRLGDFRAAREYFEGSGLQTNLEGVITAANLLEQTGRTEMAIDYLRQFIKRFSSEKVGPAFRVLTNLYIKSGDYDKAIESALSYSLQQPLDFEPRILLIRAYEEAERHEAATKEAQTLLRQFRNDPAALTQLGLFAREVGDVDLARRLYELALEGDIAVPRFGLIFLEAHLADKQFANTIELCEELERENPDWLRIYRAEFAVMQALAHLGLGNQQLGNIYLNEFLAADGVMNNVLFAVAKTFEEIGLPEYALQVLEEAYSRDDADEGILSHLIDLQVTLGESRALTDRVQSLLKLRRPEYAIFKRVKEELNSDRFVFAESRTEVSEDLDTVLDETQGDALNFPAVDVIQPSPKASHT